MIQNIKINAEQSIEVNTSMGWLFCYKNQFGRDILPDMLPLIESLIGAAGKLIGNNDGKDLTVENLISSLDDDMLNEAFDVLSGMETLTIVQVAWAMAKNANSEIELPETWVNQFDCFPLDVIIPEIFKAIVKSSVSSKNAKSLMNLMKAAKKSTSKKSSSALLHEV